MADMVPINIVSTASGQGLKQELADKAAGQGIQLGAYVRQIYTYAVDNQTEFKGPVRHPRPKGGDPIGASVSKRVREKLDRWAVRRNGPRRLLCCYILEKALEKEELLNKILS